MIEQKDIYNYCRNNTNLTEQDWVSISQCYKLDENFLREFHDRVNWYYVCKYQKMSEDFMMEFGKKLWLYEVLAHQEYGIKFLLWLIHNNNVDDEELDLIARLLEKKGYSRCSLKI